MKFKLYHPGFITMSPAEEREYDRWHEVGSLKEIMMILDPANPNGSEFFVESRGTPLSQDAPRCLMEYTNDGKWWVRGYVHGGCPDETAVWDNREKAWKTKSGLPEKRYPD